jgi:hypothetical protein
VAVKVVRSLYCTDVGETASVDEVDAGFTISAPSLVVTL